MSGKEKNPAAVALGKLGGHKGGVARAARLTAAERSAISKHASDVRWSGLPPSARQYRPWQGTLAETAEAFGPDPEDLAEVIYLLSADKKALLQGMIDSGLVISALVENADRVATAEDAELEALLDERDELIEQARQLTVEQWTPVDPLVAEVSGSLAGRRFLEALQRLVKTPKAEVDDRRQTWREQRRQSGDQRIRS